MEEYLRHWWNGELTQYYHFWWLTIPQLNKLAKIGQFIAGLLLIFEFIKFETAMNRLSLASSYAHTARNPSILLMNLPNMMLRFIFGMYLVRVGNISYKDMMSRFERETNEIIVTKTGSSLMVRAFNWLEANPVSEREIKRLSFILFVVFSILEIFTSS